MPPRDWTARAVASNAAGAGTARGRVMERPLCRLLRTHEACRWLLADWPSLQRRDGIPRVSAGKNSRCGGRISGHVNVPGSLTRRSRPTGVHPGCTRAAAGRTAARGGYRAQLQSAPQAQRSPHRHPGRRSFCPFWQPHVQMAPGQDLHAQALRVVVFVMTGSCEVWLTCCQRGGVSHRHVCGILNETTVVLV